MTNSAIVGDENIRVKDASSESVLYQAVNNVLSMTTTNGNKMFCPLCIQTCEFKYDLLDHLKNAHFNFLSRTVEHSYLCEECPFCFANFFGRHTVVKHVLHNHSKVIAQLYLQTRSDADNCCFCGEIHSKKNAALFTSHIEQKHFSQFTVLFEEQFMNANDSLSFVKDKPGVLTEVNASEHGEKFFDFSCLKEQLNNVESNQSGMKSILKCKKMDGRVHSAKKIKACRILNFDSSDENNEKSVLIQNINSPKQITFAEHTLLCHNNNNNNRGGQEGLLDKSSDEPLRCSTPIMKQIASCNARHNIFAAYKPKRKQKPTFKSYFYKNDFVFKCGKCSELFRDNGELNFHIKKNHKMFMLDLLHPCYQCGICKAKFFKNHYLRKHIRLHSSYNKSPNF